MPTKYMTKGPQGRSNIVRNAKLHNIFQQHEHDIMPWVRGKGYNVESISDGLIKNLQDLGVTAGDTLYDKLDARMDQLGFVTGTLDDKLSAFFEKKAGKGNRGDNEDWFWANNGTFT